MPSIYSVRLVNVDFRLGLIDDGRHAHPHPHRPPPWGQDPPRPGAREPRVAAPTGRPPAHRAASTAANRRPPVLGPAVPPVGRLDGCHLRRPTRDRDPVAADRLQALLDLEEPPERARPPGRRSGGPRAHPTDVHGEPPLGRAADSRGAPEAGHRDLPGDSVQVHRPPSEAAIADLAHVSRQPHSEPRLRGLLHRAHGDCSRSCSSSWSWRTIGDASSTSTSPTPPRPSGRPSNSWRRSPGRPPRDTSCATAMRSTGSCSRAESRPWGSTKSRRRLGRLGRIRTWNASSGPCAASASTTVCHECRTEKGGNAAEEMRAGPSESGCRTRLQTPSRCVGQEPAW